MKEGREVIMQGAVQERLQISPFMAAYIVVSMQIGIGVLSFQRAIAKDAGYDAWISVIVAGLSVHIIVWMMYKICEMVDGDVMYANVYLLGKIIGNSINTVFIFYFIFTCTAAVGGMIQIIQTWMFSNLNLFWFAFVYLLLGIYIVYGGFRVVAGISFFSLVVPSYLLFSFGFALPYADFTNLLPIFDHTFSEMVKSGYNMSLSYLGFGVLLFFYPFIKRPKQSKKWVHIGLLLTTVNYTCLAILTFAFFPEGLLARSIWPTMEMWKIVRLPFVERIEYLGIANWSLLVLPHVAISLWVASRIIKRVYHVSQKKSVLFIALVCLIISVQIPTLERMKMFLNLGANFGFILAYVYTPLLYFSLLIKKKVKTK